MKPRPPKKATPPKKPSGAEFRKRRAAAEARAKELLEAERSSGTATTNLGRYQALDGPGGTALGGVQYANRCAAALLRDVMVDASLDEATRRKQARELIAAIGLTSVKAIYEERLAALTSLVYRPKPQAGRDEDGLESLEGIEQ